MARRGWWKRDSNARRGDGCKRRDARWPRGRRRPVHFRSTWSASCIGSAPNCVFGPRQRAEFSTAGGLTRTGSQRRHVGTSQIRRESTAPCSRDVVAITGFTAAHAGRISDDRRPTSTVERQTSWTTHELTSRRARNPAPRHPRLGGPGPDRRQRRTCHPRKIRRSGRLTQAVFCVRYRSRSDAMHRRVGTSTTSC
jgi:hypothetical protein